VVVSVSVSVSVSVIVAGVDAVDGVAVVIVFVVVLECVSVLVPPAGEGFTIVVLFSVFVPGDAPGATVSTRCSQAPRSAALASMQIYFFMIGV
jgi:hypothetical protein